jgi:hypothetical protein
LGCGESLRRPRGREHVIPPYDEGDSVTHQVRLDPDPEGGALPQEAFGEDGLGQAESRM